MIAGSAWTPTRCGTWRCRSTEPRTIEPCPVPTARTPRSPGARRPRAHDLACERPGRLDPALTPRTRVTELRDCDREAAHPGAALDLRGVEEEGNSFREETPALQRTDARKAYVHDQVARDRRLALYDGHTFSAPEARQLVGGLHQTTVTRPGQARVRRAAPDEVPAESGAWFSKGLVVAMAGLFLVLGRLLKH